jgi:hypothetical protein
VKASDQAIVRREGGAHHDDGICDFLTVPVGLTAKMGG